MILIIAEPTMIGPSKDFVTIVGQPKFIGFALLKVTDFTGFELAEGRDELE